MKLTPITAPSGLSFGFLMEVIRRCTDPGLATDLEPTKRGEQLPVAVNPVDGRPDEYTRAKFASAFVPSPASMRTQFMIVRAATQPEATSANVSALMDRLLSREAQRAEVHTGAIAAYQDLVTEGRVPALTEPGIRGMLLARGIGSLEYQSQLLRWPLLFPGGSDALYRQDTFDPGHVWPDGAEVAPYVAHLFARGGMPLDREAVRSMAPAARQELEADATFDVDTLPVRARMINLPDWLRAQERQWALEVAATPPAPPSPAPAPMPPSEFWDSAEARAAALAAGKDPGAKVSKADLDQLWRTA